MNNTAAAALIAAKSEIDAMLAKLAAQSADHFGANPDKINWADAGSAQALAAGLRDLVSQFA